MTSLQLAAWSGPGVAGPGWLLSIHCKQALHQAQPVFLPRMSTPPDMQASLTPRFPNTAPPTPLQFFVVGHDCGHRSFSKNKLVEDIVGTLAFAPLIYPFEPWRIKHNHHHAHTNKCAGLLHSAA